MLINIYSASVDPYRGDRNKVIYIFTINVIYMLRFKYH